MIRARSKAVGLVRSGGCGRRGTVAAEFALLAPFLFSVMIGMYELSRGMMVREVLSDAARRGCRTGALPARSNSDVMADVNDVLTSNGITASKATTTIKVDDVTYDGTAKNIRDAQAGQKISVQVSIPLSEVYWITKVFLKASDIQSETFNMMRQGT